MDFDKSIKENLKNLNRPFLVAHRGVCGANIPCNTMLAYKIAVEGGADVIELDVSKSSDGKYYVFHPGMEPVFLKSEKYLKDMTATEIEQLNLRNSDSAVTSYKIPTLKEVLSYLKGKVYINVDKFWTDVEGISREIREAGVEKQVIVKTYTDKESLLQVEKYASDLMFMPMVRKKDDTTEYLLKRNINFIGNEILFDSEEDEVASDDYIKNLHDKGLLVWADSIIYNEADVISAHRTDDRSLNEGGDAGWGWLADKNVDFIQTDWLILAKRYFDTSYKRSK